MAKMTLPSSTIVYQPLDDVKLGKHHLLGNRNLGFVPTPLHYLEASHSVKRLSKRYVGGYHVDMNYKYSLRPY